jgi:hypothetical protein
MSPQSSAGIPNSKDVKTEKRPGKPETGPLRLDRSTGYP